MTQTLRNTPASSSSSSLWQQTASTAEAFFIGAKASAEEFASDTKKRLEGIEKKASSGDLLGASWALMDAVSPGTVLADALDAIGGPGHPVAKELVSAATNFVAQHPVAAVKDLADAFSALRGPSKPGCGPSTAMPETPLASARRRLGTGRPSGLTPRAGAVLEGYRGPTQARPEALGRNVDGLLSLWRRNPGCAPVGTGAVEGLLNAAWRDALRGAGFGHGRCVKDIPVCERSGYDILNDPTLCFEDMVAMFMALVIDDMEDQVRAQLRKLEHMNGKSDAAGSGTRGGGSGSCAPSDGLCEASDLLAEGAEAVRAAGPAVKATLELLGKAAPVVTPLVCGAITAAGGPVAIGGVALGTVVGVGLSLLCEGGKMAVDAGACDAVADLLGGAGQPRAALREAGVDGQTNATRKAQGDDQAQRSHNLEMERLKLLMQRMQQMQQALSNVLNNMHEGAMNSIRNIK